MSIGDISEDAAAVVDEIKSAGGEAIFVHTDVTRASELEQFVAKTVEAFGGLHCAFNNAGALPPTQPLAEVEEAIFDNIIAVDLKSIFLSIKSGRCSRQGMARS